MDLRKVVKELGNLFTFMEKRCVLKSYVSTAVSHGIQKVPSWSDRGPL